MVENSAEDRNGRLIDPRAKVARLLIEQSGVIAPMARKNPELIQKAVDFFAGNKNILIVAGESGMGKSLAVADLRKIHKNLQNILPVEERSPLCVLSWDRTHQAFFEEISTELGETVPSPSGETHINARAVISSVLGDQILFARKYLGSKIILEAPLMDTRGETVFEDLGSSLSEIQVFVMHSPKLRYEILESGRRLMHTSGQVEAMISMRDKLLFNITGKINTDLSLEEQDEVVKQWWVERLKKWNGFLIDWNSDDDREGFEESRKDFMESGIKPDVLTPKPLSRFTRRQYESIFESIKDIEKFLRVITS